MTRSASNQTAHRFRQIRRVYGQNNAVKDENKEEEEVTITRRRLMEEMTVEGDGHTLTDAAADSFRVFDETDDGGDEDEQEHEDFYMNAHANIRTGSRGRGGIYDEQDFEDEIYHDLYHQDYVGDDGWDHEEFT